MMHQHTFWKPVSFILSLLIFYSCPSLLQATVVTSEQECRDIEKSGGSCVAIPKMTGDTVWCASQSISANSTTPVIIAATPATVPQDSTFNLLLTAPGANFTTVSSVQIGSLVINKTTVLPPSQVQVNVTVPATTAMDIYDVVVKTSSKTVQGACLLEVVEASTAPQILSINPSRLTPSTTPQEIEIYGSGTHFNTLFETYFGDGITGTSIQDGLSATHLKMQLQIDSTVPTGFHDAVIFTNDEMVSEPQGLLVIPTKVQPVLTSLTPSQGALKEMVVLAVEGTDTHFKTDDSFLKFSGNGVEIKLLEITSETSLQAVLEISETALLGERDVFVITGEEIASLPKGFRVQAITTCDDCLTTLELSDVEVPEDSPQNTVVGTFSLNPPPSRDYSITLTDNGEGHFKVVKKDLQVAGSALPKASVQPLYQILAQAIDSQGNPLGDVTVFTITVTPVNHPPTQITLSNATVTLPVDSSTIIGTLTTTDVDEGDYHTYSFVDETESRFSLYSDTLLVADSELTAGNYTVKIRTTDYGGLSKDVSFTIHLLPNETVEEPTVNQPPADLSLSNNTVTLPVETGTVIGTFTTTDADAGDFHTYTFVEEGETRFAITGDALQVADNSQVVAGDYSIKIRTTDAGGLTFEKELAIHLTATTTEPTTNHSPTDLTLSNDTVTLPIETGLAMGTLTTTDEDVGDSHTYTFVEEGETRFAISGDTLQVADSSQLVTGDYSVKIRTTDTGTLSFDKELTIHVQDSGTGEPVNHPPTDISLTNDTLTLPIDFGTVIGTLTTTDADVGDYHTYSLVDDTETRLALYGDALQVADSSQLVAGVYSVKIRTTDYGGLSFDKEFTLKVVSSADNHPPTDLSLSNQTITSDSPLGTSVGIFTTTDEDPSDTHSYTLLEDASTYFVITGDLLQTAVDAPLAVGNYSLKVQVTDSGGLTFEKTITVDVVGNGEDQDQDGVLNYLEDAAPNGGDGNGDGVLDSQQGAVASLLLRNGQDYLTVAVKDARCVLQQVQVQTESAIPTSDADYDFPKDLISLELPCSTADLLLYYHGDSTLTSGLYRSYQASSSPQWQTLTQATLEATTVGGNPATLATVPLQDGGGGDDGNPDGRIVSLLGVTTEKPGQLQFGIDTLAVDEYGTQATLDNMTGSLITIPVTRTGSSRGTVTIDYTITDGSALVGSDYYVSAMTGTLTWADGETQPKSISILILDDQEVEGPETFSLQLSSPSGNVELGTPGEVVVTINDNEGQCTANETLALQPQSKTVILKETGESVTLTFTGGQGEVTIQQSPDVEVVMAALETSGEGGTQLTLTPVKAGQTQLILADCANSQAVVTVTVQPAEVTPPTPGEECQTDSTLALQPAHQDITLSEGEVPLTLAFSGGQEKRWLSKAPDGVVVTMQAPTFLENGGALVTLTPRKVGQTELAISDCASQATVSITVVKTDTGTDLECQTDSTLAMQPAQQEVILEMGEAPLTLAFTGGQSSRWLSQAPDGKVVTMSIPIFPDTGGAFLTLTPRAVGKTTLTLSDCASQATVKIQVTKPKTLAYYCEKANKTDGICQTPDRVNEVAETAMAKDAGGNLIGTTAYFFYPGTSLSADSTQKVVMSLFTDPAHVGQAANLLMAAKQIETGQWLKYDGKVWQPWDGLTLSDLVVVKEYPSLPAFLELSEELTPAKLLTRGTTLIYVGYRLVATGNLVFNGNLPLRVVGNNGVGISFDGQDVTTKAHFTGQLSTSSGQSGNDLAVAATAVVTANLNIQVDPSHVGQAATLAIVFSYGGQFFTYDASVSTSPVWRLWAGNLSQLAIANAFDSLPATVSKTLKLVTSEVIGELQPGGEVFLYVGYRLGNGTVIFNGNTPWHWWVTR